MTAHSDRWSGRAGFILATVGSAVGIGSIWKFPYEVGANGGSTFVGFYVAGLVLIVVPLMLAEFAIGRRGRADPSGSMAAVALAERASRHWAMAGTMGVLTGFLILSFYSVIGGWTIGYAVETARHGLPGADAQAVRARFEAFLASPWQMLAWHGVFMSAAAAVVARGVARGIETASMVLMPLLVALMLALAAYSIVEGDLAATLRFLLEPDLSHLSARTALEALGLGFFSIGVGLGLMITYAAYSGAAIDLKQVAVASVVADTLISLLAGLAVFPIVFAHGLDPASGPGLVFVTLPIAFARMPFGTVAAVAFFVLLFVAALASAISLLELMVALLTRRLGWRRPAATWGAAASTFVAGIATVLSFNLWANWHPLAGLGIVSSATVFDLVDQLTSNLLLPLGGLAIASFAGWAVPTRMLAEELRLGARAARALRFALRYVAPAGIVAATLSPVLLRS
ncbi:MAG TPA: sodium-dependent transporter [Burkholderiaceae bacterium]|jgi:NSS family neurotransmitter:Na+ symporter|nr:sodium-dependent transporter [Burkholderiaceae bacterium]